MQMKKSLKEKIVLVVKDVVDFTGSILNFVSYLYKNIYKLTQNFKES